MKKKINRRFAAIAAFSILMTLLAVTAAFYSRLKTQVFSDLKVMAELLSQEGGYGQPPAGIRVTVVDADGTVRHDSAVAANTLENHLDRPEIKDALATGSGHKIRMSDTLSQNTFYYAMRMENGQVIRVGRESTSVIWLFFSAIPILLVMAVVLGAVCLLASHYLAAAIVAPIQTMAENLDHMEAGEVYEELRPFIEKIRSQHEEILSGANMRQEFTANVTHELKTPLAAILGYAELMETGVAKETDIRRFSGEIKKNASRLLALINDILKLSKLDAGGLDETLEVVDLAAVAEDSVEMLSIHASKMDVDLSYQGCGSAKVRIGKELAQELAYNLIENAIRYNKPGGSVRVCVAREGQSVSFTVADTGIGIPAEHRERIFERFYRVDKSRSKELGGTGLGLAIVKHICSLTRGELCLESEEGQGTSVTITWENTIL